MLIASANACVLALGNCEGFLVDLTYLGIKSFVSS